VLAGLPGCGRPVILYDGSFTRWTPRRWPSRIAGSMAFKAGARRAKPTLIEPIMRFRCDRSGRVRGAG